MNEDSSLFLLAEVALIHNANRAANVCCEKRKTLKNKELKITYQNGENLVDLNDLKNLPSGILFNIFVEKCHIEDYLNVVYVCKFGVHKSCDTRFSDITRDDKLRKLKHVIQCHLLQHLLETKADTLVKIPSKSIGFVKAKFPITENISIANQPWSMPPDTLNSRPCGSQKPFRTISSIEQSSSTHNDSFIEIISPEEVKESLVDDRQSHGVVSCNSSYSKPLKTEDDPSHDETRTKENLEREIIAKQLIEMSESVDVTDSSMQSIPTFATQLIKPNPPSVEDDSKLSESVIEVVEYTEEPSRSASIKKVKKRQKKISNSANLEMNNLETLMRVESAVEMEKKTSGSTPSLSGNGKKLAIKSKSPEHVWDHSYANCKRKTSSSSTSDGSAMRVKNRRVDVNNLYHFNGELSQELSNFMLSEALGCSETATIGSEVEVTTKSERSQKLDPVSSINDSVPRVDDHPRPKKLTRKENSIASMRKVSKEKLSKRVNIVSVKRKLQPVLTANETGRNYTEKFVNAKENLENVENSTDTDSSNILKKVLMKDYDVKRPTIITNVWNSVSVQYS